MLIELVLLASSCSVSEAVMGNCLKSCENSVVIGSDAVTLCRQLELVSKSSSTGSSSAPGSAPNKKPESSASGEAEIKKEIYPIICVSGSAAKTAPVGARKIPKTDVVCYRDVPDAEPSKELKQAKPNSNKSSNSLQSEVVAEIFSTTPNRPEAFADPEILYADEPVRFSAVAGVHTKPGMLLGEPVSVKFVPISATWDLGDGREKVGFSVEHVYGRADIFQARATVRYSVDYRFAAGEWVVSVGSIDANSNGVFVTALPLPRETRLVG